LNILTAQRAKHAAKMATYAVQQHAAIIFEMRHQTTALFDASAVHLCAAIHAAQIGEQIGLRRKPVKPLTSQGTGRSEVHRS
jgi:hypothetical protein